MWLEALAQTGGLDRRQTMMGVVQQERFGAELVAQPVEECRDDAEVCLRVPSRLERRSLLRRLIKHRSPADAIRVRNCRNSALSANGLITEGQVVADGFNGGFGGIAAG